MSGVVEEVVDEVVVDPARARVYTEGWQSWSPASWFGATAVGPRPDHEWQHLMRFRPGTPIGPGLQGEGLLVVDPGTGGPARCYGTPDPVAVPTIRAVLHDDRVVVRANGRVDVSEHADGGEAALVAWGDAVAASHRAPLREPPTVWCSWYRYFEDVTAADVEESLDALARHELDVEVVQIDDGWSLGWGEYLEPRPGFGSLPDLVHRVHDTGRRSGLWLAPFLVGTRTRLARQHPEWLVGPAGTNWGQDLAGLDLTHPGVRDLLVASLRSVVDLGVDYLKLDFLYGAAVPGRRHADASPAEAYRSGLALVRETVGPDVYLVGCGAPLLPSVGLVDAMRVSPDTFHEGGEDGSTGLRGLMPLAARAWQHGRLWVNDPDCLVARASYSQRRRWADAAIELGGLASFSDRVDELDAWGLATVRRLLDRGGSSATLPEERVRAAAAVAQAEVPR